MYNHDTEGNIKEEFVIDKSGVSLGRYTYRWDASGRCIEESIGARLYDQKAICNTRFPIRMMSTEIR